MDHFAAIRKLMNAVRRQPDGTWLTSHTILDETENRLAENRP
ncbi:MAG: hypothetical protein ACK5MY_04820 [Jhaorihella sp.]